MSRGITVRIRSGEVGQPPSGFRLLLDHDICQIEKPRRYIHQLHLRLSRLPTVQLSSSPVASRVWTSRDTAWLVIVEASCNMSTRTQRLKVTGNQI